MMPENKHRVLLATLLLGLLSSCSVDAISAQNNQPKTQKNSTQSIAQSLASLQPGDTIGQINLQGQTRTYLLHVPKSYRSDGRSPLVLAFHGYGSQGKDLARSSGMSQLADREGFVVVYPDGLNRRWSVTDALFQPNDVAFTEALIQQLTQNQGVDRRRVYAAGVSNGGFLVQKLACTLNQRSPTIAAFASVAATLPKGLQDNCRTSIPAAPMLMMNGTADQKVPWQGGNLPYGSILSVPTSVEFWKARNGCPTQPSVKQSPTSQVTIDRYVCQDRSEVELVTLRGAGHVFPRGGGGRMSLVDGSRTIWDFFQRHAS